ncbi:MAG TPA: hypothetical protein PLF40_13405 [Kofleriaceae bacterium]|nr:hypothetical protein [Kofleriaceae bacterium]
MKRQFILLIAAVVAWCSTASCGDNTPGGITVVVPAAWAGPLTEMVQLTPYAAFTVTVGAPSDAPASGVTIVLSADASITTAESYQLLAATDNARGQVVHASDVMGAQYGLAHALENLGFRFRHPRDTFVPWAPTLDAAAATFGVVHKPDMRVRGLHLHTLHPIEGYFASWEPGSENLEDFRRIVDWLVKNRGNLIQYPALDDIITDPARHAAWKTDTQARIALAHARGVKIGIGMQLFGSGNLQLAFDLSDDKTGTVPIATEVAARLPLITDGLPFDQYSLSFGEFFGVEPQRFVDSVNAVAADMRQRAPAAELHAVIHVGGTDRVDYMGQNLIYYFLVKFADPAIIPDIHTVMYYNLFEDAGGAYHQDNFFEARQYLTDRRCANQRAAYFPETAYWVSFDISLPQFLPLYVRNRWLDLQKLREALPSPCGKLDEQILFSSGWEWNYWLNDYTALRASYELPAHPVDLIAHAYGTDLGPQAAALVNDMADLQKANLMDKRLTAYFASRDLSADIGDQLGIVSQPDRITFPEMTKLTAPERAAFERDVLAHIDLYVEQLDAVAARLDRLGLTDSRWLAELRDGIAIDRVRGRFMTALYRTQIAYLDGGDATKSHTAALNALDEARKIVARRHRDLHDGRPRLRELGNNATFYLYGYLFMADTLCFWERELRQMELETGMFAGAAPSCLL